MSVKGQHQSDFWDTYIQTHPSHEASADERVESLLQPALLHIAERALAEAGVAPRSKVVDIAAAAGTVAYVLARAGMDVLAIDFSSAMVDQVASYGIPNLRSRQMDGQALDLADDSFDAAFSLLGVTLFEDWRAGLREMRRVVRPNGVVSVASWISAGGGCAVRHLYLLCQELFPEVRGPVLPPGMAATLSVGGLRDAMVEAGFEDVKIVTESQPCMIDRSEAADPDRLFMFSTQWGDLSASQKSVVVEAMNDRFPATGHLGVESTAGIATARVPEVTLP